MGTLATQTPTVPRGWRVSQAEAGGVDLRVEVGQQRKYIAVAVAALAIAAGWRVLANWRTAAGGSALVWMGITLALSLFAAWCAFADELWHIERNRLAHRVGIGPWVKSCRYTNAELEIKLRFSTEFSVPYYRLYAVENGKPHFLLERGEQDLHQLTAFISFHTGWPIRPMDSSPKGVMGVS